MFGLFKNWAMHQMALISQYHGEAFLSGNMAPLLWSNLSVGAISGAAGTPTLGMINQFAKFVSHKSLLDLTHQALGYDDDTPAGYLSDFFHYGFPGLLGLSLQGQSSAPGANPLEDLSRLTDIAAVERATQMKEFLAKAWNYTTTTGESPMNSQEIRDAFVHAAMPKSIYRYLQITQDGALKSLKTEGKLIGGFSTPERFLYAMGLPSSRVDKFFDVDNLAWSGSEANKDAIDALGSALVDALYSNDIKGQQRILLQALQQGVFQSVARSAIGRYKAQDQDQLDRNLKDYQVWKLRQVMKLR